MDTNGYCSYHTLRDILPSDYQPFSGGKYWGILLFRIVPVNPHRRASSDHEYKWSLQARSFHSPGNGTSVGPTGPSSEHILIVRAPGARDQHGCHSTPFIVGALRARRAPCLYFPLQACSFHSPGKDTHVGLRAAVERGPSQGARSGSTGPTWVSFPPSLSLRYMVR